MRLECWVPHEVRANRAFQSINRENQIMKTKKTNPPSKAKVAVKLKDLKPKGEVKGGSVGVQYNPKELTVDQSVPWKH